ncbi:MULTISPECIES: ABC transporter ATP-binding protein [Halorubrum]|uniref:Nickel import system ATP-binding protein NikD n=1 Tax=Halorubrum hochstenium ATCC 700873 TaxID=1227481 RepID=M0FIJ9_9EURY|nr:MULTISPECIES: ABC transporter ATP-binding protein [Halorubrum]ELZ59785.1 peptide ABC transporter ATPase [Halorubrum hochstenium ATCC 700873]
MPSDHLLEVEDLTTTFGTDEGTLTAVDGVDFDVDTGETVCIVGESGSGKTVATESITRLIKTPPGQIEGTVRYKGRDLLTMPEPELRNVRGNEIAHIFQNPQEAMNHCYSVGWQITEALQIHQDVSDEEARAKAVDLMDRVGIANASARFDDYPHEFSGGQKQRVMIAMALVGDPDLLIADEPTTALDVTVQAQILRLLDDLQEEFDMGVLFVTHDLGVVAEIADRIVVMYAGKVMERGGVLDIFDHPAHPYTQQLLECLPEFGGTTAGGIPGTLPDPHDSPDGCRFAPRCGYAEEACRTGEQPDEIEVSPGQRVSCVHYGPGMDPSVVRNDNFEPVGGDGAADGESGVSRADD